MALSLVVRRHNERQGPLVGHPLPSGPGTVSIDGV